MNNTDTEYFKLIDLVLSKGRVKHNRTGIDTIGVFGAQARFNLQEGFPLLTTKKVFFKGIAHELLWFLSGSTNIKYLVDNDVHIWDAWAYKRYVEGCEKFNTPFHDLKDFLNFIKRNEAFAKKWGELGEGTYGGMWRNFPYHLAEAGGENPNWKGVDFQFKVDQIQNLVDKLKNNPDDRRMIVSAWHPYWVDHCALPPCHCLFQFHTEELTISERVLLGINSKTFTPEELKSQTKATWIEDPLLVPFLDKMNVPKRRLNCQLYQRSADLGLGVCFNWASYSLLTHMIAQCVNMIAGDFVWTAGDLHIYTNHIEALKIQKERKPFPNLPKLILNPNVKNLFDFKYEDIKIEGYESHPSIKMDVAV